MNEFIVWDEKFKKFVDTDNIIMDLKSGGLKGIYGGLGYVDTWKLFNYIGKKDINNKKIYADSSIVEFIYRGKKIGLFGEHISHEAVSLVGFFTYNNDEARYEVDILGDDKYVCLNFDSDNFRDINIIDTIQENKLGLIK